MQYTECPVLARLKRSETPLVSKVRTDEFTEMVNQCFDFEFTGESKFYPFEMPELPEKFGTMCIVGASGSGKSTLVKSLEGYRKTLKTFDDRAIVSNFETPDSAKERLSAVGLNSLPVWCRPRKVLSVGEGFRADLALNIDSFMVFDEFTSVIDRNVAKSACFSIQQYIRKHNLTNIVFSSCHKDFIPFLNPDFVIDLDEQKVYDARDTDLGKACPCKSLERQKGTCGAFLGSITI